MLVWHATYATGACRNGYLNGKGIAYGFWNVNGTWEDMWNCQVAFPTDFDAYANAPNRTQRFKTLQVSCNWMAAVLLRALQAAPYHSATGDWVCRVLDPCQS